MNEVLQREKEMARDLLRQRNLKLLDDSMRIASKRMQLLVTAVYKNLPECVHQYVSFHSASEQLCNNKNNIIFVDINISGHEPIWTQWIYRHEDQSWKWIPYTDHAAEDLEKLFPYYMTADQSRKNRFTVGLGAALVFAEINPPKGKKVEIHD